MSCPNQAELAALVQGKIQPEHAHELDLHVAVCARCRYLLRQFRKERDPTIPDTRPLARAGDLPFEHSTGKFDVESTVAALKDVPSEPIAGQIVPVDQFIELVGVSGLVVANDFREQLFDIPAESRRETKLLARELVARKVLTRYQAGQLCRGRRKGLVLGDYAILDKLGSGGTSMVFKARNRRDGRIVAIKVIAPELTNSPSLLRRFEREVAAASRLNHPNIVHSIDFGIGRGLRYLVMEYVDGADLAQLVNELGPLPLDQTVNFITQTAAGMEHAHRQGIVHRDIKPANLLVNEYGVVKLLDMGLARLHAAHESDDQPMMDETPSHENVVLGTADYMAPEQAADPKIADHRVDIYGLGCTMYFLLFGKALFERGNRHEAIMAHQLEAPPRLRERDPNIPEYVDDAFAKMVAKNPDERFARMKDVREEFEDIATTLQDNRSWIRKATDFLKQLRSDSV